MINDDKVDAALEYLRTNASKAAQAKANRIYLEEFRKTIKANQMQLHLDKPLAAQEREAYASEAYRLHLLALKDAIHDDEFNRWGLVAASATLDAWRTEQATRRGEQKLGN